MMVKGKKKILFLIIAVLTLGLIGCEFGTTNIPSENPNEKPNEKEEWKIQSETKPTCTEDGKIIYVNSATGETKTETTPALGHKNSSTIILDEQFADVELTTCENCNLSESTIKFIDNSTGSIKLDNNLKVTSFDYVKDNLSIIYSNNNWELKIDDITTIIDFKDVDYSLSLLYVIVDNLPKVNGYNNMTITVEENTLDGSRMGVVADVYRVIYTLTGDDEVSYKFNVLKDTLETVMLQEGINGMNNFYTMDGTLICSMKTTTVNEDGTKKKYTEHYNSKGEIVNLRVEYNNSTYLYEADKTTLVKAIINNVYYDAHMNEITEVEWYAIPLAYGVLWNEAWAKYGQVETTYNGGSVAYTLNADSTVNTFEYVKDDVKVTCLDGIWTVTIGELSSPITFEEDTYSLRLIYRIIDTLPELEGNTGISITVEPSTINPNRMGLSVDAYRIVYELTGDTPFSYKPYFLTDSLTLSMIQLDKNDTTTYFDKDGNIVYYTINEALNPGRQYTHCAPDGTVLDIRRKIGNITYIYAADGTTLIKANNSDGIYYDAYMNEITEAEWYAIPLNYSYLCNAVWAEISKAELEYNGGSINYTLNADSTVNTFEYVKDDVKVTCLDGIWTITIGEVSSPITFEEDTYSLRLIYRIIDTLPDVTNYVSLSITVENNVLNDKVGFTNAVYRVIYELTGDTTVSYKYSFMADTFKFVILHESNEDNSSLYNGNGDLIYIISSTMVEEQKVYMYCLPDNTIINYRISKNGITYYYEADGATLIKAKSNNQDLFYNADMTEITEAEWYAIETEYSRLYVSAWHEYGLITAVHNNSVVSYTLNADSTVNTFEYVKDNVKLIKNEVGVYLITAEVEELIDTTDKIITSSYMLELINNYF